MSEKEMPTPEEARQELAKHLTEEQKNDTDFWKKHDARIAKERKDAEPPAK